jgi:hypothetical protein
MPNIGTSPDTHLLDALLYFAPNCCQVVHVEPQYHYSPLLPLASHPLPLPPPPLPRPPLMRFAVMPLPPHLEDPLSLFDVLSRFQEDAEFATNFDFIGMDFGADFTFEDAFDLILLILGHLNTAIYLVNFLLSVCCSYGNATEGSVKIIAYFARRTLRSHVGTGISHIPG